MFRHNDIASQNSRVFEDIDKYLVLYNRVFLLSLIKQVKSKDECTTSGSRLSVYAYSNQYSIDCSQQVR